MNVQPQFVLTLDYNEYHSLLKLIHYMACDDAVFTRDMFLSANNFAQRFGIVIEDNEDDDDGSPTLQ